MQYPVLTRYILRMVVAGLLVAVNPYLGVLLGSFEKSEVTYLIFSVLLD